MNKIPILYINLENREDRNKELIEELDKYNLKGERVNAISHNSGMIGCALSHIKCIDIAIERKYDEVCILEDDFIFINDLNKVNIPQNYDVFLLGGTIQKQEIYNEKYMRILSSQRTEGYIIKKHYYHIFKELFCESVKRNMIKLLPSNNQDMMWKKLQKKDLFLCDIWGVVGGQREGYSNIINRNIKRQNFKKFKNNKSF